MLPGSGAPELAGGPEVGAGHAHEDTRRLRGGPGMGPIGLKEHLIKFMPHNPVFDDINEYKFFYLVLVLISPLFH